MGVKREELFDWKKESLFWEEIGAKDVRTKQDSLFGELILIEARMTVAHAIMMTASVAERRKKDGDGIETYLGMTAPPRIWNSDRPNQSSSIARTAHPKTPPACDASCSTTFPVR